MSESETPFESFVKFLSTPLSSERPYLLRTQHILSLHFDHLSTQSMMSLQDPNALKLGYTRTMMGFLLLQPAAKHICMIGLGGGSLAKYCYLNLPSAKIDAIEINPEVIALREEFRIPSDDSRFKVTCADGADFIARHQFQTDVILLDAFLASGMPTRCADIEFFIACRDRLTDFGVLVINFTEGDAALPSYLGHLRSVFGTSYAVVRCGDDSSFVAFAWPNGRRLPTRSVLAGRSAMFPFASEIKLATTARCLAEGESLNPKRLFWRTQGYARWELQE